ncbi:hypothetical protein Sm713_24460 [Streptomyces sp. TS71-3]|nr:hypothetical protein Sm713_24460 [Streptomyces sp. TS71-3]
MLVPLGDMEVAECLVDPGAIRGLGVEAGSLGAVAAFVAHAAGSALGALVLGRFRGAHGWVASVPRPRVCTTNAASAGMTRPLVAVALTSAVMALGIAAPVAGAVGSIPSPSA